MNYRFVIVEDNREMIEILTEALRDAFSGCEVVSSGFGGAPEAIKNTRPDAVILDLAEGINKDAAEPTWAFVWKDNFCPIVIHSAFEDGQYEHENHPFRRYERKGRGSETRVVEHLKNFAQQIDGVRTLREEIELRISNCLREVAPLVWNESAGGERAEMLRRVTRRRVAASLDVSTCDENIRAVEQFIYPPLEATLLTGDMLRRKEDPADAPLSYRVVLTPSCDLVTGENRTPVTNVLVAHCVPVDDNEILRRCNLLQVAPQNKAQKLGKILAADAQVDMIVLPSLEGCWPAMVADLKRLHLIDRTTIAYSPEAEGAGEFVRVASMDSPFRERVAWRYASTEGRPGLPVIDFNELKDDVAAAIVPIN